MEAKTPHDGGGQPKGFDLAKGQRLTLADVLQVLRLEELPARQLEPGDLAFLPRIGLAAVLEVLLSPKTVTVVVDDVDDSEHVLTLRPDELVPVAPARRDHRRRPLVIPAPPVEADIQAADDARAEGREGSMSAASEHPHPMEPEIECPVCHMPSLGQPVQHYLHCPQHEPETCRTCGVPRDTSILPLVIPAPPVEADIQGADDARAEAALQRRNVECDRPVSRA